MERKVWQCNVLLNTLSQKKSCSAAVLCSQSNLVGDGNMRTFNTDFLTLQKNFPGCQLCSSEDGFHNLGTSGTDQSGEGHDLARICMEGNIVKNTFLAQVLNAKHFFSGFVIVFYKSTELTAYHTVNDRLLADFIDFIFCYPAAIAEDGAPVADNRQLRHSMCYIDQRCA